MSSVTLRSTHSFDHLDAGSFYHQSPDLSQVLRGTSHAPWTLSAFTDFLNRNFCAETLQFTKEVAAYREFYEIKLLQADSLSRAQNIAATNALWQHILQTYVAPSAVREINIPGTVRNELLSHQDPRQPPSPAVLQSANDLVYEMMAGIFAQFVESVRPIGIAVATDKVHCRVRDRNCSEDMRAASMSPEGAVPFYRRAHGSWGTNRVYRSIKQYPGFSSRPSSPFAEKAHSAPAQLSMNGFSNFGKRC